MIFFFGTKAVQRPLPPEWKVCPTCLSVTQHAVVDHDTRFALYFIPLFSVKREVGYTCTQCGDTHTITYSEYQAAHPDAARVSESPQRTTSNADPRSADRARKPETKREKARTILEGKIVDSEVKTYLPFTASFTLDRLIKWLWIAFGVILLAAAILLIILFSLTSR